MWHILIYLPLVTCYFEQILYRNQFDYNPRLSEIIYEEDIQNQCPEELLEMTHNETYVTQLCFSKDVFYNMEILINDQVYLMAIDLTSPWSWIKSDKCYQCRKQYSPIEYEKCKVNTSLSCDFELFNKTYHSQHWQDSKKTGQIYSHEVMIEGKFVTDDLQFLAYNETYFKSLSVIFEELLGMNESLSTVPVSGLKFLEVNRFIGFEHILADGAIGLGFGYTETDEEGSEPDTDFVEALVKQNTHLQLTRQQFAIYIQEDNPQIPHQLIQFGGFDYKYAHKKSQDIVWLNRLPQKGYFWIVQIDSIYLSFEKQWEVQERDMIDIIDKQAVFTLSSQWLELPKKELFSFLQQLNSLSDEPKCHIVDNELYMIYCKNLDAQYFDQVSVVFRFEYGGKIETLKVDSSNIYRKCVSKNSNESFDCELNVKYSQSNLVVLGEPFMKSHYVIFANEPGILQRIGLLPAASDIYEDEHEIITDKEWPLYRAVVLIFIFGMILICCAANIRRCIKEFIRSWRYSQSKVGLSDHGSLRVKNVDTDDINDVDEDYERNKQKLEDEERKKREEEWKKSNEQFNFQSTFENVIQSQ